MWCMIDSAATNAAAEWLRSGPESSHMPGVSHDDANTVYAHTPPQDVIKNADSVILPVDIERDSELVAFIGYYLVNEPETVILGDRNTFIRLYRTPHWRLWCGKYESWRDLEDDHMLVFGEGVDGRAPLETLIAEAKTKIYNMVSSQ